MSHFQCYSGTARELLTCWEDQPLGIGNDYKGYWTPAWLESCSHVGKMSPWELVVIIKAAGLQLGSAADVLGFHCAAYLSRHDPTLSFLI